MKKLTYLLVTFLALSPIALFADATPTTTNPKDATFKTDTKMENKMMTSTDRVVVSDEQLMQRVRDVIKGDKGFSEFADRIDVKVNDGVVTLKGDVSSDSVKNDVENRVKSVDGVKKVTNNLTVSKTDMTVPMDKMVIEKKVVEKKTVDAKSMDDSQLSQRVIQVITTDKEFTSFADRINVKVDKGVVFIKGTVDSDNAKAAIERKIKGIEGVQKVNNEITVTPVK